MNRLIAAGALILLAGCMLARKDSVTIVTARMSSGSLMAPQRKVVRLKALQIVSAKGAKVGTITSNLSGTNNAVVIDALAKLAAALLKVQCEEETNDSARATK